MTEIIGRIIIGAKTIILRVLPSGKVVTDEYERPIEKDRPRR